MSNSSLVNYTLISPMKTPMSGKINRKITIHHMAGNLSVEDCGRVFQTREASANYGVGTDGRVGLYVDESDRSWASSSRWNDEQAVTIEVANDDTTTWHVSDTALEKTIELCVDICKRNGIPELVWTGDSSGTLTVHRFFAATACPGDYLFGKMQYIADEVNKRLKGKSGEWVKRKDGRWLYYIDGKIAYRNCWAEIDGKWYYFSPSGLMIADRYIMSEDYAKNGLMYYINKKGAWNNRSYRWIKDSKGWMFQGVESRHLVRGKWLNIGISKDKKTYYVNSKGYCVCDKTVTIKGKKYKFDKDGVLIGEVKNIK